MNILILHPEGNYRKNPTLNSLLNMSEFKVGYFSRGIFFFEKNPIQKYLSSRIYYFYFKIFIEFLGLKFLYYPLFFKFRSIKKNKFNFIIACDYQGSIEAYILSNYLQIPYCILSFEILKNFKPIFSPNLENNAYSKAKFLIIQDEIRLALFEKIKDYSFINIFYLPISSKVSLIYPNINSKYKKNDFGIKNELKIILFTGSISSWTGINIFISYLEKLPLGFCLLVNGRKESFAHLEIEKFDNLFFTEFSNLSFEMLNELVDLCDFGFVWYLPDFSKKYLGYNISPDFIGASSGKLFLFMSRGKPVLTNIGNSLGGTIIDNNLGLYDDNILGLFDKLKIHNDFDQSLILKYFNETFAFDNFSNKINRLFNNIKFDDFNYYN